MNPTRIRNRNRLISLFPWITRLGEARRLFAAAAQWRSQGWFAPPPFFVRRAMLLAEARAMEALVFVETGTFLGDTTWAFRCSFEKVHTIEVEATLAQLARERFAGDPRIEVIEGDSSQVLPELCDRLSGPCLFYLDGHYSGGITGMGEQECPILQELDVILARTRVKFRIVIDDARLFGTDPAYPTLEKLHAHLEERDAKLVMRVENDAILITRNPE